MAYMVFVEGGGNPRVPHSEIETARDEAYRLARNNIGKIVRVLQIVESYKGTVTVEEYKELVI